MSGLGLRNPTLTWAGAASVGGLAFSLSPFTYRTPKQGGSVSDGVCPSIWNSGENVMNEITKDEARPLTDVELDAVTGGLANAWLDWIADNFYLVKMEAHPTVIEC